MILDNPCYVQFCNSNLLEINPTITVSSETVGYEFSKALNYNRQQTYKPTGRFLIETGVNTTFYFNDGSDKTALVPASNYATGTAIATALQNSLNTASSGFTVTYSSNRFTIARSSAFTLRLSQTSAAIHYTLGLTSITNVVVAASISANEKRCHYPYEEIAIDFGFNAIVDFFGMIGRLTEEFQVSDSATVTLLANNINDFTSPPLSVTATVTNEGAFYSFNEIDSAYRYWRIRIQDFQNPLGGTFEISNCYLGQGQFLEFRNVSNGFDFALNDTTTISESESGVKYFDESYKFFTFDGLTFAILTPENKDILLNLFNDQGTSRPFYLCLDPSKKITTSISRFNRLVRFTNSPRFNQVFYKYYTVNANFTEHF